MKKIYILVIACVLFILTGCAGKELPAANGDVEPLKDIGITRNGDLINPYPEIDIGNITSLPVYRASNVSLDPCYKKIIELETEYFGEVYGFEPPFYAADEWRIRDCGFSINLINDLPTDRYNPMLYGEEEHYSASNWGFNIYFRDILQDKYSGIFPFPFDECPPVEINNTISSDEAVNMLIPAAEKHIKKRELIYPNDCSYTDSEYYVVEKLREHYGLILNFRPQEMSSDRDVLLDYFNLCKKVSFELQWFGPEQEGFDPNAKCVSLDINCFTTNNYEYLGDYKLITVEEAKERLDNGGDDVFAFFSAEKGGSYDHINLLYVGDKQGYIRPVYAAVNGRYYTAWTDAVKR